MRKNYQKPEIWMEEIKMESPLLGSITKIEGKSGNDIILNYEGGGSGPARAGESGLWDEEEDSEWN